MPKKTKKSKKESKVGAAVLMVCISLTVTGIAASIVARDHHDGVAIAHLTIALILIPLCWVFPLAAVCWLGALLTLVSVPSSRHILAAQWTPDVPSNGTGIGSTIGSGIIDSLGIGQVVELEQGWAHKPYVGLCACDILGIILGVMGTPLLG